MTRKRNIKQTRNKVERVNNMLDCMEAPMTVKELVAATDEHKDLICNYTSEMVGLQFLERIPNGRQPKYKRINMGKYTGNEAKERATGALQKPESPVLAGWMGFV